jgi:hypothetical protein
MKEQTPQKAYAPNWLSTLDNRTTIANDLRQRHKDLCDDLGGIDALSYQKRALIDRAIFLEFHLQDEERKLATGADFDSGRWVQAANSLSGIFSKLGLNRTRREVSLNQYIGAAK